MLEPTGVPTWGHTILELLPLVPPASSASLKDGMR